MNGCAMTEKIPSADEKSIISKSSAAALADLCEQGHVLNQLHSIAEFNLDAEFMRVNENYLELTGYGAEELLGKNLNMLLDLKYQHSVEYQLLWQRLRRGETVSGQFKRIANGAKTVWINASYIPVIELTGSVLKVVEYATDVTEHVQLKQELADTMLQVKSVLLAVQNGDLSQQIAVVGRNADLIEICTGVNAVLASTTAIAELVKRAGVFITEAAARVEAASKSLINSRRR